MIVNHDLDCVGPNGDLSVWGETIRERQMFLHANAIGDDRFNGRLRFSEWGEIQISEAVYSPISYRRSTADIRSHDSDAFIYVLYESGGGTLETGSSIFELQSGDIAVYDLNFPFKLDLPVSGRTISVRIPRALLRQRVPMVENKFAVRIDRDVPMGKLAADVMKSVASLPGGPKYSGVREAAHSLVDMLCLAVREVVEEPMVSSPGQATTLRRIKAALLKELPREDLSIECIASEMGVSPRTLNRLFATEGTTVMRWLQKQRLTASYQAMSRGEVRQVTEAAFSFGFKDCSHFSRAFKKEFGVQPRHVLGQD